MNAETFSPYSRLELKGHGILIYGRHVAEDDLSLYAVRALDFNRNTEVQRHLDTCVKCRSKLAEIIGGLSLLTLTSSPEEPSSDATAFLLNRIKAEARLQRPVGSEFSAEPGSHCASIRSWVVSAGWVLAAVAITFAIYLAGKTDYLDRQIAALHAQGQQTSEQHAQSQRVVDLLTSRTAVRMALAESKSTARATAEIIYDKDRAALIFIGNRLRPLSAKQHYSLWLVPANGLSPIRAGLFRPDPEGNASLILPPLTEALDAKTFGVTIEDTQTATGHAMPFLLSQQ